MIYDRVVGIIEEARRGFKEVRFVIVLLDEVIVWGCWINEDIFMTGLLDGVGGWGR